jgi:carbamoyl-phosphate synthase small subunit
MMENAPCGGYTFEQCLTETEPAMTKAILALEDGRTFACRSFTGPGEAGGEVVFNTSMSGYQEVLTDPSYSGQMVTMTYPLIGNYGVNAEDVESDRVQVAAFLVREYQANYSNYRATGSLADYLAQSGVMGVDSLDTRALTRHIRNGGALRGVISTATADPDALV